MNARRGPFKPTTQRLAAVLPSSSTRHETLEHALIKITKSRSAAKGIVDEALADFGATELPDEDALFTLFVRAYVVPRTMAFGSVASIEAMLSRVLG